MALRRTVDRLRERPRHERTAVAGSIALGVVAVLFVGWAAFFLHGIGSGASLEAANPAPATPTSPVSQTATPTTYRYISQPSDQSSEQSTGSSANQ